MLDSRDSKMTEDLEKIAKQKIESISKIGYRGIGPKGREIVQYCIKLGLVTQDEVNALQKEYEANQGKYKIYRTRG